MTTATISIEAARGCGHRKPSKSGVGVYLVGPAFDAPCGRLPFELRSCPTCGGGVKPSRGWNWVEPKKLFGPEEHPVSYVLDQCEHAYTPVCSGCPLGGALPEGRHGLVWVGKAHYPTPRDFLREAQRMGISRKVQALPKGFELDKTWVYLAHRKAITTYEDVQKDDNTIECNVPVFKPAVFAVFKPTGVDLVVHDKDAVPERAKKLAEQVGEGARIIQVVPASEQTSLPIAEGSS